MNAVFAGAAGTGALVGLLISLSATPVVATFLPLLLSLFGGAGGIFAFKVNFAKANTKKQLILFGWSLAAFSLAAIVGVFAGISTKHLFYAQQAVAKVTISDSANQADLIRKLTMRKRLDGLGATRPEIEKFFAYRYDPVVLSNKLVQLDAAAGDIISIYDKAETQRQANPSISNPFSAFSQLVGSCRRFQTVAAAINRQIQTKTISIELAELLITNLRPAEFTSLIRSRISASGNASADAMIKAVTSLYAGLLEARAALPLQAGDKEIQDADKVWVTGQPSPQQLPFPPIPTIASSGLLQLWN